MDELLRNAVADKLAQLLNDDEAGWYGAASWIDKMASEKGFDLAPNFESAQKFAGSLMEGMRFHADLEQRFPNGIADLANYEIAEELFWHLVPHGPDK